MNKDANSFFSFSYLSFLREFPGAVWSTVPGNFIV